MSTPAKPVMTAEVLRKMKDRREQEKLRNSPDVKIYLILYNAVQALGWGYMLLQLILHYVMGGSVDTAFDAVSASLKLFQTLAVMEVVHSLTKVVPSPFFSTFVQVLSRVYVTWCIVFQVQESQDSIFFSVLIVAWGLTEIVRYSYYALNVMGKVPFLLKWLRYTTFIVLYPLGVSMELALIYTAAPVIRETGLWTYTLPNQLNFPFNFYYFQFIVALSYIPGFKDLYFYMWKQRKIQLSKRSRD